MQKHFLSMGLWEFKLQNFCPGVWPSPWKKRWLLGKEPDLPTRQDIHASLPTHSGDGNLGCCTHAAPASCILRHLCALPLPWCSPVYRKLPAAGKVVDKLAVIPLLHCSDWERGERTRLCLMFWVITPTPWLLWCPSDTCACSGTSMCNDNYRRPLVPGLPQLNFGAEIDQEQFSLDEVLY